MTTGKGLQGKAYWALLGVTLPDHLSDAEADRLMRLILASPSTPWEENLELIGRLANMSEPDIAALIADRQPELKRYEELP